MTSHRSIRFFIDPATAQPHVFKHDVSEEEVLEILENPGEDRKSRDGSRTTLGQTSAGRFLKVIYVVDAASIFVITAMELHGKPLLAYRRRRRRK
jgi:hypothetical protein